MKVTKHTPLTTIKHAETLEALRQQGLNLHSLCEAIGAPICNKYVWQVMNESKDLKYKSVVAISLLANEHLGAKHNWPMSIDTRKLATYALEHFETRETIHKRSGVSHRSINKLLNGGHIRFAPYMDFVRLVSRNLSQEKLDECFTYPTQGERVRISAIALLNRCKIEDVKPLKQNKKRFTLRLNHMRRRVIDARITALGLRAKSEGLTFKDQQDEIRKIYAQEAGKDVVVA